MIYDVLDYDQAGKTEAKALGYTIHCAGYHNGLMALALQQLL